MRHNDKLLLSLAGLLAGILLACRENPPLILFLIPASLLTVAFLNRKALLFAVFMFAGIFSSYLAAGHPSARMADRIPGIIPAAEGEILELKPHNFSDDCVVKIKKIYCVSGETESFSGKMLIKAAYGRQFTPGDFFYAENIKTRKIPAPKNPGDFDYRAFMNRRGIYIEGKPSSIIKLPGRRFSPAVLARTARMHLCRRVEQLLAYHPEEKELVETLLLGKEKIPGFLKEAGIKSGTYHLLVISGLHVAFIILFLKMLFIPFGNFNNSHPKFFPSAALILIWFYAGITGFKTPVVRAVLMFTFFCAGEIAERDIDGLHSIMAAMLVLLLLKPYGLFDASFQLSFAAAAGIILACRRFNLLNRNFMSGLALSSLSAQTAVLPLIFYHFGTFYPAGLLNNLFFLPFTGIIIVLSLITIVFPLVFLPVLTILLSLFLKGLTVSAGFSPTLKFSAGILPAVIFYCAAWLVFFKPAQKTGRVVLYSAAGALLLLNIAGFLRAKTPEKAYFPAFGKTSAVFIARGGSLAFLADHYKKQEIENILVPALHKERASRISGLFYTETSFNHHGTLNSLLGGAKLARVYEPASMRNSSVFPYMNSYYYQSIPGMFEFIPEGSVLPAAEFEVELLGEENSCIAYVVRKGKISMLIAPYIGEYVAEKIKNRRFSIACIGNIKKSPGVMRNINKVGYLYLILPAGYKKFGILPAPRGATFYLNYSSVKVVFDKSPFSISYLCE
ncbi:MAG: ComEC/Rec2 family competence protein [Candidatus Omnitrophica bacterium]|nr:ComEC/Rec2 family competence protein [Candidatus Omnitrophota bacterium]